MRCENSLDEGIYEKNVEMFKIESKNMIKFNTDMFIWE